MKKINTNQLYNRFYCYKYKLSDRLFSDVRQSKILMFHHIVNGNSEGPYTCQSTIQHFVDVINSIKSDQLEFVSIDEAIARINNRQYKGYCVMTFDDGCEDVFISAYPILKLLNIPFTIYLTINFLDKKGYMSREEIRMLNDEPLCTIGAHTLSHPRLKDNKNALQEIYKSKVILEELLKKEVKHFAYPYGSLIACSRENMKQVQECGYISAVSTISAYINSISSRNRFFLPRINGDLQEVLKVKK